MYIHILHFSLEEFYETHQNKKSAQVFKMWEMYQIEGKDFRKQQCRFEQDIEEKFRKHVNKQLLDREIYEVNIKLAEVYPEEYFSIAIDGADFQRFGLPFFSEKDKDSDKGYKIPISLNGVKVHGHGCLTWIFPSNLPKDPNCTIHCLQDTFYI